MTAKDVKRDVLDARGHFLLRFCAAGNKPPGGGNPPLVGRGLMNTPLSRGENRLFLLGRVEPSNPPPRGNLSIFEEKQAANLQVRCTFNQGIFRLH